MGSPPLLKMPLTPMTRDALHVIRAAKEAKEEEQRKGVIASIVDLIYNSVRDTAENTAEKKFCYLVPYNDPFYKKNLLRILDNLIELFPDSRVYHTVMAEGYDGKLHDIADLTDLSGIKRATDDTYIIIDWS